MNPAYNYWAGASTAELRAAADRYVKKARKRRLEKRHRDDLREAARFLRQLADRIERRA